MPRKFLANKPHHFWSEAIYESFNKIYDHSGGIAQLGERLICIQEVIGSIPFTSTIFECGRVAQLVRAHP